MDMSRGSNDDAWKIFNRDTEAGRLLSRLYGVVPSGSVTYPKQRRRRRATGNITSNADVCNTNDVGKTNPGARSWKTTYTVHGWNKAAEEEKEQERKENISRALSLPVPKVGRGGEQRRSVNITVSNNQIHLIPRRKTEVTCRNSIAETKEKALHYRPPNSKTNVELEKKRLQGGSKGRCLPEDLTSIPNSNKSNGDDKSRAKSNASRPSTMFDQIHFEILERRKHQMAMEEIGAGEATRESTAHEIKERLEQLKQLDSQRALSVVKKLMKS
mmetsp:Transcript_19682/g.42827  ORF Transcript_19682/g.42827 Transcript_19682/m.42827 type:complete len:272 (-) Transcript_19682:24-839(-)